MESSRRSVERLSPPTVPRTHSAGLSTKHEEGENLATSVSRIWGGLIYRLPRLRNPRLPRLDLRVGIAHMGYDVDSTQDHDLSLTALAVGGTLITLFKPYLGMELGGEYRVLVRSRASFLQAFDTRTGSLQGFHVIGGLQGKIAANLGYRATITAERFVGDLSAIQGDGLLKVRDWFFSGDLALTYEM